ncbi:hypothetical protein ACJ6WE_12665 [Streptomyces sp. MMS24-I31]|uniref:hypothetical protein n=1 Tax=Streptomyces sp. MMS24-I31 TaxID=3351563 RepID=UPI00389696AC
MLVTLGLLVLMALPSLIGIVRDKRVDRQISEARKAREVQESHADRESREVQESHADRESREVPKEREEAQKSSSRSTVPSTATWYADGRRSKKLVSS